MPLWGLEWACGKTCLTPSALWRSNIGPNTEASTISWGPTPAKFSAICFVLALVPSLEELCKTWSVLFQKKTCSQFHDKKSLLNWLALPGFTLSVLVVFSFCIWQIRPIPVMDASPSGVTRCGGRWIHGLRDELVLEPLKLGLESSWVDPGKTGTTGNLQRTKRVIIILEKQINLHPSLLTDKNKRNHLEFLEHRLQGGLLFSVPKCPAEALGQLQYRWPDGCTI